MTSRKHILHVRSSVALEDGSPKLPTSDDLDYGEIAVNYASGVETLSIRNSENSIATFPNRTVMTDGDITNITAAGNMCVICDMTESGTLSISDTMIKGQTLRVIAHNSSEDNINIALPTDDPYVVMSDSTYYTMDIDGYAVIDVICDGTNTYLTMVYIDSARKLYMDVCLCDAQTNTLNIVSKDDWNITGYPSTRYIPVGVVVVPASHCHYDDEGTICGVISLMSMDYENPDTGCTVNIGMCAGGYGDDLSGLDNFKNVPCVGTEGEVSETVQKFVTEAYLPSDNHTSNAVANPYDTETTYYYNESGRYYAPSPYNNDGTFNTAYSQVIYTTEDDEGNTTETTKTNALSDFDGKGNTEVILKAAVNDVTVTTDDDGNIIEVEWKKDTVTHSSGSGYYPAALSCYRFHTKGTSQGDWYLPAAGELGYAVVRQKAINNTIATLLDAYGNAFGAKMYNHTYCSSSEYGYAQFRYVGFGSGFVSNQYKNIRMLTRAFLRVSQS